jgi:drug/metabolite transporter (DMT)-like permease
MSPTVSATMSFLIAFIPIISLLIYFNGIHLPKFIFVTIVLWIISVLWTTFRFKAYQLASASYIAMMFSITPFLVTILWYFILHENLSLLQLFGWCLIVLWWILVEKLKI